MDDCGAEIEFWEKVAKAGNYRVGRMASLRGLSRRSLYRLFERRFGKSVRTWLMELKLRENTRLAEQVKRVKTIGSLLGYRNVANFCRFKRKAGSRPTAHRGVKIVPK